MSHRATVQCLVKCVMCYVNFVWEILYCHLWASSECMMQFLDTHKSDRDACRGPCNDDPKMSKNETRI